MSPLSTASSVSHSPKAGEGLHAGLEWAGVGYPEDHGRPIWDSVSPRLEPQLSLGPRPLPSAPKSPALLLPLPPVPAAVPAAIHTTQTPTANKEKRTSKRQKKLESNHGLGLLTSSSSAGAPPPPYEHDGTNAMCLPGLSRQPSPLKISPVSNPQPHTDSKLTTDGRSDIGSFYRFS